MTENDEELFFLLNGIKNNNNNNNILSSDDSYTSGMPGNHLLVKSFCFLVNMSCLIK